ncbi:MAG: metallophosphoesterase [Bradymonadaceae bacterium]
MKRFAAMLVGFGLAASCIGDAGAPIAESVPSGIGVGDLSVAARPGVPVEPNATPPVVWLTTPTAQVEFGNGRPSESTGTVELANVWPDAPLEPTEVVEREVTADGQCGQQTEQCDCSTVAQGRCAELCGGDYLDRETTGDARARIDVTLPACLRVRFQPSSREVVGSEVTVAVLGRTDGVQRARRTVGALDDRIDFALLLGDHLGSGDELDSFGELLRRDAPVPVVVTPGERELEGGSTRAFRREFGPLPNEWRVAGIQFATVSTPRRTLGSGGVERLRARLRSLGRTNGPLVIATHTPPFDPVAPRDGGFKSRLEGARAASLFTRYGTDLLLAGHVSTRDRASVGPTDVLVAASPDRARYTVAALPADADEGADARIERRSAR